MFREEDYSENIEYCKYVWKKNNELNLGLESREEIQIVANMYYDELVEIDGYNDTEYKENDLLLLEVVKTYIDEIRSTEESYIDEDLYNIKMSNEKLLNARGGYGYNESYDDLGSDEVVEEDRFHL